MTGQNVNMAPHLLQSQSSVVLRAQEFLQEQQLKTLLPPHKRFSLRSKETDENRAYDLRENKLIGQTIDRHENCFNINQAKISVRRVEFRWQRGNKIGFGSTGIVYACVNLDTGEMMAMKEIQYKPNDLQMIKSLADEIANIEGIKHENLVKFYGVELHKKEILIFMEFCGDKCTLGNFD
jgi:mitogen-activated protein kinase kinase kinase 4